MKRMNALIGALVGLILLGAEWSTEPEAGFKMPSIGKQIVTFSEYERVQNGMSYAQVVNIIGAEGEEMSRNKIDGVPGIMESIETVMYQWVNNNGGNMMRCFRILACPEGAVWC
jgi:hypothetical protein